MSNREELERLAESLKRIGRRKEFDPTPGVNDLFKSSAKQFLEALKEATLILKETFDELKQKTTIKRKYYEIQIDVELPDDAGVIAIKNAKGEIIGYILPSEPDDLYSEALLTAVKTYIDQLKK